MCIGVQDLEGGVQGVGCRDYRSEFSRCGQGMRHGE